MTVRDLDETLRRIKRFGASIPAEPQLSPDGQVKVIYATGPDGVLLELVEIIK
jgi:predicted enzyme related to lactoylglutathione lyase